ncbi:MAG: protein-L-isoaspartate(D-aspartate) O-methyltransferase [Candidatus Kerfeldbacteria bacterium]|nr:protein-L-isoaspartate(D-aspartate) O-methyltransferase [Candidatus Kerfeldbacteria bacterium]
MTNDSMVDQLVADGRLKTERIIAAWRAIDRARFVPPDEQAAAYENRPLPIGFGQTISQPLTVAIMLEALQPRTGERVLDIGAGSGWVTALLATIVGPGGSVVAIERIPQLARKAKQNLISFSLAHVELKTADGSRGWPSQGPYDIIHVAAAAPATPAGLKQQLRIGGRLIIPVGQHVQDLVLIERTNEQRYSEKRFPGFQFVPLIASSPSPS